MRLMRMLTAQQVRLVSILAGLFIGATAYANDQDNIKNEEVSQVRGIKPEKLEGYFPVSQHPQSIKTAAYANPDKSPQERANDLISRLTFEEKLALTTAVSDFNFAGVPRLGIRPVTMSDASQGLRTATVSVKGQSTSLPGMMPLASTWNLELAKTFGKTMAEQCRALGVDVLLGPGINMQRQSVNGRNYEYMGEDPLLTGAVATAYIQGLQSVNIVPTAKHFIGNDQEFVRHISNSVIDERTLREIYLRPWEKIIKDAGAMGIMTGNNQLNGISSATHKPLVADVLRKEFGFEGIAVTDWQNTRYFPKNQHLVLPSTQTMLMPDNETFKSWLEAEIKKNPAKKAEFEKQLEVMIYPNLYTFFKMGTYDREPQDLTMKASFVQHQAFARQVAEEAIVLLKNEDNILPIKTAKRILFISDRELYTGVGSGFVKGYDHVSYKMALQSKYGDSFTHAEHIDQAQVKQADVVIFNLNKLTGEGRDTPFEKPVERLKELEKLIKMHSNIVVLLSASNTMPTPWLKDVKGVLWLSFLGQERGYPLARIISGELSPSGKLPFTFEKDFKDSPDPEFNYIGGKPYWKGGNQYKQYWLGKTKDFDPAFTNFVKPHEVLDVNYNEGVFMGYRWFEAKQLPIVFPFGHGLSYTQFEYSDLSSHNTWSTNQTIKVKLKLANTGTIAAKEVVQLYIADHKASVKRPIKELKAFKKVHLMPAETKTVEFELNADAFSFWSVEKHSWVVEPGKFDILIGTSSQDIRAKQTFNL